MKTLNFLAAIVISAIAFTSSCTDETINEGPNFVIPLQPNFQPSVRLGNANSFAVLASQTVKSEGFSTVAGDLGVYPGNTYSGFPKGSVQGSIEINSELAIAAQTDLAIAYKNVEGRETKDMVTLPNSITGLVITPGLYTATSLEISSGDIIIDGLGSEQAVFVIKVDGNLNTAANSRIVLRNNAKVSQIFWQVAGEVSLGAAATFKGNVLAMKSITLGADANVEGRLLTMDGSIEMVTSKIYLPE